MCLTNCSQCRYFVRQSHHSTDIVCSLNPAYATVWQRLNTLDEYTLNCIPLDNCRDFELDPKLESKTISLNLSFNAWQSLVRKHALPAIINAIRELSIELELSLTVGEWQAIALSCDNPRIRVALESQEIEFECQEWIEVDSSFISAVHYARADNCLLIRFVSGAAYRYENVPHSFYLNLLDAHSKGTFFNHHIKNNFSHTLI